MTNHSPYLEKTIVHTVLLYNPNYGDDRVCVCGHKYYRHFDTYSDMDNCGCKYCGCDEFVEKTDNIYYLLKLFLHKEKKNQTQLYK